MAFKLKGIKPYSALCFFPWLCKDCPSEETKWMYELWNQNVRLNPSWLSLWPYTNCSASLNVKRDASAV
jgi:hypothetical protein